MIMTRPQNNHRILRLRVPCLTAKLMAAVCLIVVFTNAAPAQNLRRQMRIQKRIEKKLNRPPGNQNKTSQPNSGKEDSVTANQLEPSEPRLTPKQGGQNLDGIKQRGIRSFFTPEESSLMIPGFVNSPVALLMIFRQLDLAPDQKMKIRDIRKQVGNSLALTRRELNQLESQLEEAIYGNLDPSSLDSYDPAKVKELTDQVVQRRSDVFRQVTNIESQFRQILSPDQFYVFRELVREMVRPGSRPLVNPAARQQQQQRRQGIQQERQENN